MEDSVPLSKIHLVLPSRRTLAPLLYSIFLFDGQILLQIKNYASENIVTAFMQIAFFEFYKPSSSMFQIVMLLTTKATKEIAGRYGGLENLGDKLMKSENFEMALDEIVWLITLLCNQTILVHNLKHPDKKKPELTTEEVELLTSPMELTDYKDAIMEAVYRGTKRNVESEPDPKNVQVG